jgi:GNAT superfamily N-acetyltransferase
MNVRRATLDDAPIVRSLRLQALSDMPDAFDSTLERELAWTISDWQRWLSSGATFILEQPDGPKGIAAGVPHWTDPGAVFLMSMWVHPGLRGTGAADALVASVLSWAEAEGAAEVWLHVGKRNDRARRFYERNGFRLTGNEIVRELDGLVEVEMRFGGYGLPTFISS